MIESLILVSLSVCPPLWSHWFQPLRYLSYQVSSHDNPATCHSEETSMPTPLLSPLIPPPHLLLWKGNLQPLKALVKSDDDSFTLPKLKEKWFFLLSNSLDYPLSFLDKFVHSRQFNSALRLLHYYHSFSWPLTRISSLPPYLPTSWQPASCRLHWK